MRACVCGMQQAAFPISKARKPITGFYAVALSLSAISKDDVVTAFLASNAMPFK